MPKEVPVCGLHAFCENAVGALNEWSSIQKFLWSPRDISSQVVFLKYAALTNRYMPNRRGLWEQWAHAFIREYCTKNEVGREEILERFVGNGFTPRHHAVMVEMLWEHSETMLNRQFVTDTALLFGASYQDSAEREQYVWHLRSSSVIPTNIKVELRDGLFSDA